MHRKDSRQKHAIEKIQGKTFVAQEKVDKWASR